jgi:hypothetical protein
MKEVKRWKQVVGFEGLYEVSDSGNVRSIDRICSDGHLYRGKNLKARKTVKGYLRVSISRNCKTKLFSVHALVLEAFVGPRPIGYESCHRDGNRANNVLGNLRWGTKLDNANDKRLHGTMVNGSAHYRAKASETTVTEIRLAKSRGDTLSDIAASTGLSKSAIRHIIAGRTWRHVRPTTTQIGNR